MDQKSQEILIHRSKEKAKEFFSKDTETGCVLAKTFAEQIVKCDPKDAEANYILGNCFYKMGEIDNAAACFNFILSAKELLTDRPINEIYADAYNGMFLCFNKIRDYQKAINCINEAIKLNPNCSLYHNNLALLCNSLGKDDEAKENMSKAIELDPYSKSIRSNADKIGLEHKPLRLLVGSLFASDDEFQEKLLDLQLKFLGSTTKNFDHVACLDQSTGSESFRQKTNIIKTRDNEYSFYVHIWGLRVLLDYFKSVKDEYDYFLILDSDAFPIKEWKDLLLKKMNSTKLFDDFGFCYYSIGEDCEISCILRNENFESRLHASVLFMKKEALDHVGFEHELVCIDPLGRREEDVCIPYYEFGKREKTFPLIRTNKTNVHPIVGGVYFDSFYHHGAGSRGNLVFRSNAYHDYTKFHNAEFYTNALLSNPEEFIANLAGWNKDVYAQ